MLLIPNSLPGGAAGVALNIPEAIPKLVLSFPTRGKTLPPRQLPPYGLAPAAGQSRTAHHGAQGWLQGQGNSLRHKQLKKKGKKYPSPEKNHFWWLTEHHLPLKVPEIDSY